MKRILFSVVLTSTLLASAAHANPQLAKANNCFACHSLDKKIIGPSFHDIAQKYANQPGVENKLADKIRRGSVGVWGSVPMQPMPQISDADLKTLVQWMLGK
ncbi:MAG: c-type cytochrome [Formosimonas sp.]